MALALKSQLAELARTNQGGPHENRWEDLGGARVILPADAIPWGVAHFVGGAVLGQFPELCYGSLLRPLADRTGVAVVCTAYELGTDHFGLARTVSDAFESAMAAGASRYGWQLDRMPRFALGHSLGAKLQVLLRCRGEAPSPPVLGAALLAFNNFGLGDQVRLVRETLLSMRGGEGPKADPANQLWESLVEPVIGRAARMSGMEVAPDPEELLGLVRAGYAGAGRTRTFRFIGDTLDCSDELVEALMERGAPGVDGQTLKGGHLTPCLVPLEAVMSSAPGMAGRVVDRLSQRFAPDGFQLGNEAELEALLDELVPWLSGRR